MYAETTADWNLHLVTVKRMLNLFAAASKLRKSGRLYLQSMDTFPEQNPWLQQCFQEIGHHAVIIERYWTSIWSDLVIEQVLMRSVRSRGGLSRRRDVDENIITMRIIQCIVLLASIVLSLV